MIRRLALLSAALALLSGCAASTLDERRSGALAPEPANLAGKGPDHRNPALVFVTPEMGRLLAARGLAPGFDWGDWEYHRNDERLSVGQPVAGLGEFRAYQVDQYDQQTDSGGRPREHTRRTVRSTRFRVSP